MPNANRNRNEEALCYNGNTMYKNNIHLCTCSSYIKPQARHNIDNDAKDSDNGDDDENNQELVPNLLAINRPISYKLRQHCSKKAKQSTRRTNRYIVLNKEGR